MRGEEGSVDVEVGMLEICSNWKLCKHLSSVVGCGKKVGKPRAKVITGRTNGRYGTVVSEDGRKAKGE